MNEKCRYLLSLASLLFAMTSNSLAASKLQITTPSSLGNISVASNAKITFTAKGGNKPYKWSISKRGSLPGNFKITKKGGAFTGNYDKSTTAQFSVKVVDSKGQKREKKFTLKIIEVPISIAGMVYVKGGNHPIEKEYVKSFYIGQTEATWNEWSEILVYSTANGYDLENVGPFGEGGYDPFDFLEPTGLEDMKAFYVDSVLPMHNLTWQDAAKWCNAKSQKEGLVPVYKYPVSGLIYKKGFTHPVIDTNANGYRLPTASEWEWAASGGIRGVGYSYSGSYTADDVGWYNNNNLTYNTPKPVAKKMANELRIYDMTGNVAELCSPRSFDDGHPSGGVYYYERGGDWMGPAKEVYGQWGSIFLDDLNWNTGFRYARNF